MAVDSACTKRLPSLKFVGDTIPVSALIILVTLTFDVLTSNLVRVITGGVGNFPTNFGISGTFRSRLIYKPTLCDLATLTFDLGGMEVLVILHLYTKLEVSRPFRWEDMAHFDI